MLRDHSCEYIDDISVFGHLAMRQTEFEEHSFFEYLAKDPSPEWLQSFIPKMGFWAHVFQDALKLVENKVTDPTMRSIAIHIRAGDIGHDDWLCADMERLGIEVPSLPALFGPAHEQARMASYALMSELFRIDDDRLLIVYLLALESASYVFFETMTEYLERNDFQIDLQYFGRNHLEAELEHGIVEAEMDVKIEEAIEQSSIELRREAHDLIDRIFAAFTMMFHSFMPEEDVLDRTLDDTSEQPVDGESLQTQAEAPIDILGYLSTEAAAAP